MSCFPRNWQDSEVADVLMPAKTWRGQKNECGQAQLATQREMISFLLLGIPQLLVNGIRQGLAFKFHHHDFLLKSHKFRWRLLLSPELLIIAILTKGNSEILSWPGFHSPASLWGYFLFFFLNLQGWPFGTCYALMCLLGRKSRIWAPIIHNLLPSAICLWDSFPVLPKGSRVIIHDTVIFGMASGTVSEFFVLFWTELSLITEQPFFYFCCCFFFSFSTLTHRIMDSQGWKEARGRLLQPLTSWLQAMVKHAEWLHATNE